MEKYQKYITQAKKLGAQNALLIDAKNIVIDARTLLKCMYGCSGWNHNWTCPSAPNALKPWEFEQVLKKYKKGLLIHCNDKKLSQKISFEIERKAFIDGYYFAFSMSDCDICKKCSYPYGISNPTKLCKNPIKARPSMQGIGIDVFATVRKYDLHINTLANEKEPPDWYSLVLIE